MSENTSVAPQINGSSTANGNDNSFETALGAVLNKHLSKGNPQFRARLLNQMVQLARHGNFAETFIRTTPEGTDMVNFARLWEYVLVQADRQTRGYVAKTNRVEFEQTRQDFEACIDFMVAKLQSASQRHKLDLSGTNFISRVAQRYGIAEKVRKGPAAPAAAPKAEAKASKREEPVEQPMTEPAPRPKRVTKEKKADLPDIDAL
ncbi:MAG: hypothetical protein EBQ80_03570 [Proteobacteria bacterium]|nr:hypothetical protein [Pseudomonadota bacterium]